jgi:hypothetical protein
MNYLAKPASLCSLMSLLASTVALAQPCSLDVNALCVLEGEQPPICMSVLNCYQYQLQAGQCLGLPCRGMRVARLHHKRHLVGPKPAVVLC